ncbi:hypothetical protein BDZ89DRAFT_1053890 [Hymenopellis radicata]|nr:hypothetical protein BDZ89DRAFT_1053890 [Hymenopellis radicata]
MLALPPDAARPAVEQSFYDDPLFHRNPPFYHFYCCLDRMPKEIYDIIYHESYRDLSPSELQPIYRNEEFSAIVYSNFRRTYLPHFSKSLEGAEIMTFMKDVSSSEEIYQRTAPSPTALPRFRPANRVYTFCNIVQLDITMVDAAHFQVVQPVQHLLLLDLTLRYPPNTGHHIIPLLLSWKPKTSGLRTLLKLRLVASGYGFRGYNHKPTHIYWDHPGFARALHLFPSLRVLAFVHPAYVVPIQHPVWRKDWYADEDEEDEDEDTDDNADAAEAEEEKEEEEEAGDEDGIDEEDDYDHNQHLEGTGQAAQNIDEHIFQERQALRLKQEALYGPRRQSFILKDADWQSGEQLLITEWASPSLTTIFLVFAYDESSKVEGDFCLDEAASFINGRFSHWTRDFEGLGHWTRRNNEYMESERRSKGRRCLSQKAADLKLSGMQFAEDCWSYSDRGTVMLSRAQYDDLFT